MVAITAHGNSSLGLAHEIILDTGESLVALDLIGGSVAPVLLLGACHSGSSSGAYTSEPIGLATLAICAGTQQILASASGLAVETWPRTLLGRVHAEVARGNDVATSIQHVVGRIGEAGLWSSSVLWWGSLIAIAPTPARGSRP